MNKVAEKTTKGSMSKMLHKIPEIIGVSIGISLVGIGLPLFLLGILAPDYEATFESVMPGWFIICVVGTFIYYQKNNWDISK